MSYLDERPRLGRLPDEYKIILEEKKRQKEEEAEKVVKETAKVENVRCGSYEKGAKIRAYVRFTRQFDSFNKFYIRTNIFKSEDFRLMKATPTFKYPTGELKYGSRPYAINLGDIKLITRHFQNQFRINRCKILDLKSEYHRDQVKLYAKVLLIDAGLILHDRPFSDIYDAPQAISYYLDLEPEVKPCRLNLGDSIPADYEDEEINNYFRERLRQKISNLLTIKILDFKDELYSVDILNEKGASFLENLKQKFDSKLERFQVDQIDSGEVDSGIGDFYKPLILTNGTTKTKNKYCLEQQGSKLNHYPIQDYYPSVVTYFKRKLSNTKNPNEKISYHSQEFLRVRVLSWSEPDSIFVVPDDPEYTRGHPLFVNELKRCLSDITENSDSHKGTTENFKIGEKCLFKNVIDSTLGAWIRGVVVGMPVTDKNGKITLPSQKDNGLCQFLGDYVLYRVESIDYGFQCIRSGANMRHVKNRQMFNKLGPWSLKCRLFGVNPLEGDVNEEGEREFSQSCLDAMNSWLRERLLDNGPQAFFHILLRSDLKKIPTGWKSAKPSAAITLFHRHEPPYTIEDSFMPRKRKTRFDCLNSHLIDTGVASDYNFKTGVSSNVDLDHFIVNLLVRHDRI